MTLLYFSPLTSGGLADYAQAQAEALAAQPGVDLRVLAPCALPLPSGARQSHGGCLHSRAGTGNSGRIRSRLRFLRNCLRQHAALDAAIAADRPGGVLFASYAEYLAPFWAGRFRRWRQRGIRFGAVVHDPIRDYVVGPRSWHRRSVADAYSFLDFAFVHEPVTLDTVRPFPGLETVVIPHGPYQFPPPAGNDIRPALNIPREAPLLLAFGHVRDNKNLGLALRAVAAVPDVYLLVAGATQSAGQKPIEHYRRLASDLGIESRCRWIIRYIAAEEVGDVFASADAVLLTYGARFRSASGVLNTAAQYRKPCIASGGQGSLQTTVRKYGLGIWVEPDNAASIAAGIRQWLQTPPAPRWDAYLSENSWQQNAELVLRRFANPPAA